MAIIKPSFVLLDEGRREDIIVHSAALEGNLLGDSPDRNVSVYLPLDYDTTAYKFYPVVFFLHGFGGNDFSLFKSSNIMMTMDSLIGQGLINPMIIVAPDSRNYYGGSMYTNSPVSGNWEDFITRDLVQYIDDTYRTSPQSSSCGITGFSMGGFGSMKLAMKNPHVFSAVYSMSGRMWLDDIYLEEYLADERWPEVLTGEQVYWDLRFSVPFPRTRIIHPTTATLSLRWLMGSQSGRIRVGTVDCPAPSRHVCPVPYKPGEVNRRSYRFWYIGPQYVRDQE